MSTHQRLTLLISFAILIVLMLVVPVEYGCGLDFFWLAERYDHRGWERLFLCWACGSLISFLIAGKTRASR